MSLEKFKLTERIRRKISDSYRDKVFGCGGAGAGGFVSLFDMNMKIMPSSYPIVAQDDCGFGTAGDGSGGDKYW